MVLVAIQLPVVGLYLPPVFKTVPPPNPPHTIISLPVQIAVCSIRAEGALVVLVAVQVSSQPGMGVNVGVAVAAGVVEGDGVGAGVGVGVDTGVGVGVVVGTAVAVGVDVGVGVAVDVFSRAMWLRVTASPPFGASVVKRPPTRIFPSASTAIDRTWLFACGSNESAKPVAASSRAM
jgi:hypothetical protein